MLLMVAFALPIVAGSLEAQSGLGTRPDPKEQRQQLPPVAQPSRNLQLQQQIRRSLWRVAKQRIGFSDEQMLRLEQTSKRFDQQRRLLAQEEKSQRVALRSEILADSGANQGNIAAALLHLHGLQQRRLDLQAEEQKEFATFMTPLQRAKFTALQDQVRRRLQELARARPDSTAPKLLGAP
jgi:hypothetical protein